MRGMAVATIVASIATMNVASMIDTNTIGRRDWPAVSAEAMFVMRPPLYVVGVHAGRRRAAIRPSGAGCERPWAEPPSDLSGTMFHLARGTGAGQTSEQPGGRTGLRGREARHPPAAADRPDGVCTPGVVGLLLDEFCYGVAGPGGRCLP
jgi:hypothetical protein